MSNPEATISHDCHVLRPGQERPCWKYHKGQCLYIKGCLREMGGKSVCFVTSRRYKAPLIPWWPSSLMFPWCLARLDSHITAQTAAFQRWLRKRLQRLKQKCLKNPETAGRVDLWCSFAVWCYYCICYWLENLILEEQSDSNSTNKIHFETCTCSLFL